MYRHIYEWNIGDCDAKQPIHLTSSHEMVSLKYTKATLVMYLKMFHIYKI